MVEARDSKLDEPIDVRKGEELDLTRLQPYLAQYNSDWDQEVKVRQFPGGFSNLTYALTIGDEELILRRPPFGAQIKGGHDMHREYLVQKQLYDDFGKVAKVFLYCGDDSIIGSEFYIMQRVIGRIIRGKGVSLDQEKYYPLIAESWIDTLIELHKTDYHLAGLSELGKPKGYNRRQIEGWSRRYRKSQTDEVKVIETVMDWLNKSIPTEQAHTLIHNDYKYDNVIFDAEDWSKIKAVLDWEMSTLGDPLMDFGTTLGYWTEKEDLDHFDNLISLPTWKAGNPNRDQLIKIYENKSGFDLSNIVYFYAYGLFKTAVVVQQIYYRYFHGHTQDERFSQLNKAAEGFCFKALRAIQKNRVSDLFS